MSHDPDLVLIAGVAGTAVTSRVAGSKALGVDVWGSVVDPGSVVAVERVVPEVHQSELRGGLIPKGARLVRGPAVRVEALFVVLQRLAIVCGPFFDQVRRGVGLWVPHLSPGHAQALVEAPD